MNPSYLLRLTDKYSIDKQLCCWAKKIIASWLRVRYRRYIETVQRGATCLYYGVRHEWATEVDEGRANEQMQTRCSRVLRCLEGKVYKRKRCAFRTCKPLSAARLDALGERWFRGPWERMRKRGEYASASHKRPVLHHSHRSSSFTTSSLQLQPQPFIVTRVPPFFSSINNQRILKPYNA